MTGSIEIREERPDDVAPVRDVNNRAFGQEQEGNIVDALRTNGSALLSLVATWTAAWWGTSCTVRSLWVR
jgi:predicted N-acetyltransferase YhbS